MGRAVEKAARYSGAVIRGLRQSGPAATWLAIGAKRRGAAQKISEFAGFAAFVSPCRPQIVVEIGTLNGGAFWAFCRLAASDGTLISIDLPDADFSGGHDPEADMKLPSYAKSGQTIHLIRADSHAETTRQELERCLGGRRVDLLFIDGDHSYEGVKRDYEMYSPLVAADGLFGFHDVLPHRNPKCEVDRFWQEIRTTALYREFVDTADAADGQWGGIGVLMKNRAPRLGGDAKAGLSASSH